MSSFDRARFLFNFNRNYVAILYLFRDTASYLSKVSDFNLPAFGAPLGVTPVEFHVDLWPQKTRKRSWCMSLGYCTALLFCSYVEPF